jgi:serine/threonine-protein kinase
MARMLRGETLGDYVLEDAVGIGGMGTVFRARDTVLDRTVAIKVLARDHAADPEIAARFRNEARSAARLDHENIARVFGMGEDRNLPFIVFEFIDGINVRDLVARGGPLPLELATSYTLQIATALEHASSRNVVHRDIKPSNIVVTADGRAKLVDMGLARMHMPQGNDLTNSGVTLGTFDYISPEQACDPREVDVRSDIYSLGCTYFFMLSGRPPFPEGTVFQKLLQHRGEAPPDIRDENPEVTPEAARIIRKMMAKDPANRYLTPEELIRDLMMLAGGLGLQASGYSGLVWIAPEQIRPSFWERHLPWMVPVGLLVGAVVGLEVMSRRAAPVEIPLAHAVAPQNAIDRPPLNPSGESLTTNPGQATLPAPRATVEPPTASPILPADATDSTTGDSSSSPTSTPGSRTTPGTTTQGNGSGTTTAEGSGTATVVAPPVRSPDIFVFAKGADTPLQFTTLLAACSAAPEGATIELRYDGPRETAPLDLDGKNLTIKAGDGFRPRLVFQYENAIGQMPSTYLLTVRSGQVRLAGLDLQMAVSSDVDSAGWALIRTRGAQSVRLENCTLELANPSQHLGAAFVEITAPPGGEAMPQMTMGSDLPPETVEISLETCSARGEGIFLRTEEQQPVRLLWDNGLLVLSEGVAAVESVGSAIPQVFGPEISLQLTRVTADVPGGLLRVEQRSSRGSPPGVSVSLDDCIILGDPNMALVEQEGLTGEGEGRARLDWRDRNVYYEGLRPFWQMTIRPMTVPAIVWSFDQWTAHWGTAPGDAQLDKVAWRSDPLRSRRDPNGRWREDYELAERSNINAGARLALLPAFPGRSGERLGE